MMTPLPPSRYRVVERGRRLVVIDTLTGEAATREPAMPPAQAPVVEPPGLATRLPSAPRRNSFDGRAVLVTHMLYDLKAPRTIDLDPGATALLGRLKIAAAIAAAGFVAAIVFEPWLAVLPLFVLFQPSLRNGLRGWATRRLDRYATGSSAG